MTTIKIFATLFLTIGLFGCVDAAYYSLTEYSNTDGLSQNSINAIAQDSKGLMWIGTESGVNRFDGIRFKKIQAPAGRTVVLKLQIDNMDRIWVSWYGYPASIYNQKTNTWHDIDDQYISHINGFKQINDQYWITGIHVKMLSYMDQSLELHPVNNTLNNYFINNSIGLIDYIKISHKLLILSDKLLFVADQTHSDYQSIAMTQKSDFYKSILTINNRIFVCSNDSVYELENLKNLKLLYYFNQKKNYYNHCLKHKNLILIGFDSNKLLAYDIEKKYPKFYNSPYFRGTQFKKTTGLYSNQKTIWIAEQNTLFSINNEHYKIIKLPEKYKAKRIINSPIFQSSDGNMWFGTDYAGILKVSDLKNKFKTLNNPDKGIKLYRKAVLVDNNLWLGANEGGISRWNRDTNQWQHYPLSFVSRPQVRAVVANKIGELWAGTASGEILKYHKDSDKFLIHKTMNNDKAQINVLLIDNNNIWFVTTQKLHKYNYHNNVISDIANIPYQVKAMAFDKQKNIIIGTHEGGVLLVNQQGDILRHWSDELSSKNAFTVFQDEFNFLWVGTWGGGLNRINLETNQVQVFNTDNGLSDNTIFGIVPGAENELWLSSYNGLMQFQNCINATFPCHPIINYFNEKDGLQGKEFDAESYALLSNGEIYFAGAAGFNLFKPHKFTYNNKPPKMVLLDINLNNENFLINNSDIELASDFQKLTLEFAALDYHDPQSNQYQYRFSRNEQWQFLAQPRLEFTQLKSGTHELEIRGSNNDGVWTDEPLNIRIKVNPPYYYSWQAMVAYVLLLLFISIHWVKRREKYLQTQTKWLEKNVKQRTEELKQANIAQNKLYSSISHEIKTPLTVMLAPIEEMKADKIINDKRLDTIVRQADDLKHFINNLTNLTSLRTSQKITFAAHEIAPFLQSLTEDFRYLAQQKHISITLANNTKTNSSVKSFRRSLNIIMNNLMENAIKQTPNHGVIEIVADHSGTYISIQVKDNGKGIPEQQLQEIFDYGVSNHHENTNNWLHSLGIGLSISQETAKALGGELSVHNRQSGGACFTLKLPEAQADLELIKDHKTLHKSFHLGGKINQKDYKHDCTKSNVLIVDDNLSIQSILLEQLDGFYNTHAVGTAELGLEFIQQHHPDLVICDVMLPDQTGYDLLQKVKTEITTDDTLIIMLTAMEEETAKLKSMEFHADAHLNKPYNKKELMLTIQHLLHLKEKNQQKALFMQLSQNLNNTEQPQQEQSIYQQILSVIEEKYTDQYFKAPQIAESLNLSLSSLQRNLKAETHLTLGQIIYSFRINKAKAMLTSGTTVTQTAFNCGFSSSSHFSTKFKSITNLSPKQFINNS